MRAIDDDFVFQLGVGARHHAGHVELLDRAHGGFHLAAHLGAQHHRLEVLVFGGGAQLVEILAAGRKQAACGGIRHPAFHAGARCALGQLEALAQPALLDHAPAVRGRGVGVDQQYAGGALARGFFEFIGPAAVVGQALAVETVRLGRGRHRVVDHHDQHFAFDVHALVIVPAAFFRRADAVADEYQFVIHRVHGFAVARRPHPVLAEGQRQWLAARFQRHAAGVRRGFHAGDLDRLSEAVAVAWLEADGQRLRFQVSHGQVAAALAGAASFQHIVGQERHMGAQRRFLDDGGRFRRCGGVGRECQGQAGCQRRGH